MTSGLLFVTGCAAGNSSVVYETNVNNIQQPQMIFFDAYENVKHGLQQIYSVNDNAYLDVKNEKGTDNIKVTNYGFSCEVQTYGFSVRFDEIQSLSVHSGNYVVLNQKTRFYWQSQTDAQNFIDAVIAMKYYVSKNALLDDEKVFIEFQDKAKAWQVLPQKPALSDEVHRYRALGDDAVANKNFFDAAKYYEKGLNIEPLWPAGQFNAAMIYKELEFYPMAIMHMKRYLVLKPEDATKYRDQVYIWEEKANQNDNSTDSTESQQAQVQSGGGR